MLRRSALTLFAASTALGALRSFAAAPAKPLPEVEVFKSRYCGCCGAWAEHMKAAGFPMKITLVDDTTATRKRLGLPDAFGSCHTAVVAGYALEGHVPAADAKRLLAQRPAAIGLAVPGMVPGSPGMETDGRKHAYQVLLIDRQGRSSVFASYGAS